MPMVKDIPSGEAFFLTEKMGDDRNNVEVREVFYARLDGPCRYPNNVRVGLIAIVQGDPDGEGPPRFRRSGGELTVTEMDGRMTAHLLSERTAVWEQSI